MRVYNTKEVKGIVTETFFEEVKRAYKDYTPGEDNQQAFIASVGAMLIAVDKILLTLDEREEDGGDN